MKMDIPIPEKNYESTDADVNIFEDLFTFANKERESMFWEFIRTIFASPAGSFAFVAALLALSYWLVHYVTKKVEQWSAKVERVEKMENVIDSIKEDLHYIKATLNVLQSNSSGLTQSHSPIGLTQKGRDVASSMGIYEIITRNWDKVFDLIESQHLRNAYDIQQFCIETATVGLDRLFCRDDVDRIKNFAYNEGKQTAYYGSMIGVIIRDKYFESKGIQPSEVDDNDPTR